MEIITDTITYQDRVQRSIQKHGWSAEHNYWHYQYNNDKGCDNIFFLFDDDMGIMANYDKNINVWAMFSEILAPEEKRLDIFFQFLDYILYQQKGKKVWVELEKSFREKVLQAI